MGIYITIITLLLFQIVLFRLSNKETSYYKIAFTITIVFLAFVAGVRGYSVGHDTLNYCHIFEDIGSFKFENMISANRYSEMEQGYVWLCWLFFRVSDNFSHFMLIVSLFEFGAIGIWIWKNSKKPFLSLLIFVCMFYTFFLTGVRQCIALSILLFAYDYVKKRNLIVFSVFVILASLFHQTALIFAFAYLIPCLKTISKPFAISLVTIPILFFLREPIFTYVVPLFDRYSDYEILDHGDAVTYTLMLSLIVVLAMIVLKLKPIKERSLLREYSYCVAYVLLAIHVMPFVGLNGSFMRVAMYFSIFVCLLLVKVYSRLDETSIRFLAEGISLTVLIVLFFNELEGSSYIYEFIGWEQLL